MAGTERANPGEEGEGRWWVPALGLAIIAALVSLDVTWPAERVIIATVVVAPFITALLGSTRQTAIVGAASVVAVISSGGWNDNLGEPDWVVRVFVGVTGAAFAIAGAGARVRLGADRRRFRLLSAVADVWEAGTAPGEVVQRLSALLVPELADVCAIDVVRGGRVERLGVTAVGPHRAEVEEAMRGGALPPALFAEGDARVHSELGADLAEGLAPGERGAAVLRRLGVRSVAVVPLRARAQVTGAVTLLDTGPPRERLGSEFLAFAKVLSGRIGLALDNAGLFSELESLEAQHAAALGSLADAVTIQSGDGRLIYANDAAARSLGFATAEELLATPPQEIVDAFESFHEDGSPLRLDELPGRRVLAGETPEPLLIRAIHRATGEERWRVVKATVVLDEDGNPRLAVNVIEDVTEAKHAELSQRLLAEAGAVLASSLDFETTLEQVAQLAVPGLADWCAVAIPDEQGYLRSVAVAHVDPDKVAFAREYNRRYPAHVTDETGAAQVLRDGEPLVYNEISDELLEQAIPDPERLEILRSIGMHAALIVPMEAPGGTIGTLSLISAESRRSFSEADLQLARELGRRAGSVVENARLYTERSEIARTLQEGLLPDDLPDVPGLRLASLYRPAGAENTVGGDFYDAFPAAAGWLIIVGDVTGRGARAAALTGQARHTLRTAGELLGDPVSAVAQLNRALVGRRELSICTVAAVHVRVTEEGATAAIVCAGHPQPMLVRDGTARAVGPAGPMVGAWLDSGWRAESVALRPGDVLVLYTDGVLDARAGVERFGEERLAEVLHGAAGADDAVQRIRSALDAFERGEQADDTAVLAVECVGPGAERLAPSRTWTAPATPPSVSRVRAEVVAYAREEGVADDVVNDLRLAVSEALTNVVVHAYRDGDPGDMRVRVRRDGGQLEILVEDDGVGLSPRPDSPGLGVGLPLISAVAGEWSMEDRPGGGTLVRMAFPCG